MVFDIRPINLARGERFAGSYGKESVISDGFMFERVAFI